MENKAPRTVRLKSDTETRLQKLIEKGFTWPQVLDFATAHLVKQLEAGKEIRLTKDGMELLDAPIRSQAETAESSLQSALDGPAAVEAKVHEKKRGAKHARA